MSKLRVYHQPAEFLKIIDSSDKETLFREEYDALVGEEIIDLLQKLGFEVEVKDIAQCDNCGIWSTKVKNHSCKKLECRQAREELAELEVLY